MEECFFVGKNNFLSMLNLPSVASMYGLLRLYWDGSGRGEAFLRRLKPLITSLHEGWARCVGKKFYAWKTFWQLFGVTPKDESEKDNYYHYRSETNLDDAIAAGDVIAGVIMADLRDQGNESVFLFSKTHVQRVVLNSRLSSTLLGAKYFGISVEPLCSLPEWDFGKENYRVVRKCILLPKLHCSGSYAHDVPCGGDYGNVTHYIIGSDWTEVDRQGRFCRPLYPLG